LNLEIQPEAEGLRCSLRYDTALFRRETAGQMMENFRKLLEAMVRNPERRIRELPALSQIAVESRRADRQRPAPEPGGMRVPQSAARSPET
jgi:hypothetical protein